LIIDSAYPKDAVVVNQGKPLGILSALTPIVHLHQSPPSPVPGDWARGKRRGFRPQAGAAAYHSQSATSESVRIFGDKTLVSNFSASNYSYSALLLLNPICICSGSTRFAREFCVLSVFKKFSAKRDILACGNKFKLFFASKNLRVEFLKEIGSAQNFQGVPG